MGLAEPRKRIKISHDPRNTQWTNSTNSYGQRLMQQQGWTSGEALGAKGRGSKFADAEAAKVNVKYKDDMLGLGASKKGNDPNQPTGLDAFQGLLGRLNAKTEEEVQIVEKKLEDKKLAMFAQGKWGGMLFVPGGLLVQSDPYKQMEALKKAKEEAQASSTQADISIVEPEKSDENSDESTEKTKRKAEKKMKKEEKRLRKEARRLERESKSSNNEERGLPTPDSSSANEGKSAQGQRKRKTSEKREPSAEPEQKVELQVRKPTVSATQQPSRNGRHLLRGKNIQAKRMAFSDMKGLDEIFMKAG